MTFCAAITFKTIQKDYSMNIFKPTLVFLGIGFVSASGAFAQSLDEYFKSTEWLAAHKGDANLVLVDVRPASDYGRGHIPGAINIPRTSFYFSKTQIDGKVIKYDVPSPSQLIDILTNAGITPESNVVAYDEDVSSYGGRFPWVLRSYGHKTASVIDGGIDKWKDVDGLPLETKVNVPVKATRPYKIADYGRLRATKSDVLEALDVANGNQVKPGYVISDIRTPGEYDGSKLPDSSYDARPGHIPGAVFSDYGSFIYTDYLDAKGQPVKSSFQSGHNVQVLKKPADLATAFASKGLTKDKTIFNYCEGGFRSGVYTLVLKGLGYDKVYNYDGSWNEWSKQGEQYPVSKVVNQ
jgi:thiosulfate/3-mercaptopyruvate sulfurtransferase